MGRGFLAGIFWGAIVGASILLVSNVTMERQQLSFPRPEAVPVEVPAGSEFDQARPETEPVVPEVETRPSGEVAGGVAAPPDLVEEPPRFDTSSLEVPQPTLDAPGGLGELPDIAEEAEIDVTGPGQGESGGIAAPGPELGEPDAPLPAPERATEAPAPAPAPEVASPAPQIADEPVAGLVAPDMGDSPDIVTPSEENSAASEPLAEAEPEPEVSLPIQGDTATAPAPETGDAPSFMTPPVEGPSGQATIRVDGGEGSFFQPVDEIGSIDTDVETDRLPRIEAAAAPEPETEAPAPASEEDSLPVVRRLPGTAITPAPQPLTPDDDDDEGGPALDAWRQDFAVDPLRPIVSLVLVHQGDGVPSGAEIQRLPFSVGFAVDAGSVAAAEIAQAYRAAGREVVMIPSLPFGATPQDVEVALRVNLDTVPEAVALMDNSGDSFQSDRDAVAQVVDVVTATGHGLITFPRGLNTAHQRAGRAGVATGLIFRDIDSQGQNEEQIARAMDRAAFRARTDRPVILVGRTAPATVQAVNEWMQGDRADSVQFAPVSAALLNGGS
ncbi:hypothetical protein GQ651_03375 [Alphaproteobacteria bacterium GH1-50]|uniref:Divergent polysaccharide deacetylase n=1 Tax=Kangsaoukella pontilimi TaxID=2691042 RepID=A0A7C9MUH4_9RHOB|nr:divergent polysaccharide deacetylase family protein [Kangsaoukella pontilimi]MXQ06880.1 hypothetical protein [Kangsaoukella pontilimi]